MGEGAASTLDITGVAGIPEEYPSFNSGFAEGKHVQGRKFWNQRKTWKRK